MAGVEKATFDSPNETRTPPKTKVDVVKMGDVSASRMTFEPGWRWSECIKPTVKTDSCQVHHVGMVQSGQLHIKHDDGSETEIGPGDAYVVEPGHDAWVVGEQAWVGFEFDSRAAQSYAKS
jgi:mannose-6-phosphate isomerase-like protein (cupin superfamily)